MTVMETEVVFMELTEQRNPWKASECNCILSLILDSISFATIIPFSESLWLVPICILGTFVASWPKQKVLPFLPPFQSFRKLPGLSCGTCAVISGFLCQGGKLAV